MRKIIVAFPTPAPRPLDFTKLYRRCGEIPLESGDPRQKGCQAN
jgi:hypothetical protein